jgi:hypothetical protein
MNKKESYFEYQQPYQVQPKKVNLAAMGGGPPILDTAQQNNKIKVSGVSYPEARQDVRRIPFMSGRPG